MEYGIRTPGIVGRIAADGTETLRQIESESGRILLVDINLRGSLPHGEIRQRRAVATTAAVAVDEEHLYAVGRQSDETDRRIALHGGIQLYSREIVRHKRGLYAAQVFLGEKVMRGTDGPLPYIGEDDVIAFSALYNCCNSTKLAIFRAICTKKLTRRCSSASRCEPCQAGA